jgi:rare lipoprotein A
MANGDAYDPNRPTMAHRTLPFGTVVRLVRISTGATVVLQVADREPFGKRQRIADVSREAARRLGMISDGVVDVRLEVLSRGQRRTSKPGRSR